MKKITTWDRAPISMWEERDELALAFPDGLARLQSGTLVPTTRVEVTSAVPGPLAARSPEITSQASLSRTCWVISQGRVLIADPADDKQIEDVTDAFGGAPADDHRVVCDAFGQIHARGCHCFRRLDGSFGELPRLTDGSPVLPLGADLCGNLWSLSADGLTCHLLPADHPNAWIQVPLPAGSWKHLIVDHASFVWIAGDRGLRRFAPRQHPPQWQTPDAGTGDAAGAEPAVTALSLSPDGLVLAALVTGDLIEVDIDADGERHNRRLCSLPDPVRLVHTDTRGTVWIGTDHGLYCQNAFTTPSHAFWRQQPGRLPGGGNHDIFSTPCHGRLYTAGGLLRFWGYPTSQHCFGELFEYDPDTGCWRIAAPLLFPRRYNGIATLAELVWLVGGEGELQGPGSVTVLDTVDIYDPQKATWSSGPALSQPRTDPFVMASGERIWAAGGSGDSTNRLQTMESIGLDEAAWRGEPDLPVPAREGGCCALDGVLYCASLDGFLTFNTQAGTWDSSIPQPETLVKSPLMTAFQGEVWMMGGAGEDRTRCYNPQTRSWRDGPTLPTQQSWGAAAVLDGQLIITGGAHRSDRHDMTIYDDRTWVLR